MYFLNKSYSLLRGMVHTNYVFINDNRGRVYQSCKCHDPRGRGSCAKVWPCKLFLVKINYFHENLLVYSQAKIRHTEGIVMISKEESTKIVNFMTFRAGILVLESGQIRHIVKMHYFFKNIQFVSSLRHRSDKFRVQ